MRCLMAGSKLRPLRGEQDWKWHHRSIPQPQFCAGCMLALSFQMSSLKSYSRGYWFGWKIVIWGKNRGFGDFRPINMIRCERQRDPKSCQRFEWRVIWQIDHENQPSRETNLKKIGRIFHPFTEQIIINFGLVDGACRVINHARFSVGIFKRFRLTGVSFDLSLAGKQAALTTVVASPCVTWLQRR